MMEVLVIFDGIQNEISNDGSEYIFWPLDALRKNSDEVIQMPHGCYLFTKSESELIIHFALCEFFSSHINGSNEKVIKVFNGSGTGGALRELRHIWWGDDGKGYTFYLPGEAVIKALEYLKKYFDMD